jgi:cobalt/nickel transport system permease protein
MTGWGLSPLLAVHIADGILSWPWLAAGAAGAAALALLGAWRLRDEEVPRVALLSAAFFVASLVHVKVGGITSVHLLLNGLVGVVLGARAGLAVLVGLFLQAALFGHGGFTTLGVNACIMTVPALAAWQLFAGLQRAPWLRRPWFRAGLVAFSTVAWTLSLAFSAALLSTNRLDQQLTAVNLRPAVAVTLHPLTLAAALGLAGLVAWAEHRLENAPEFPLGLLVGEVAVLLTVLGNSLVLAWGGGEDWPALVLMTLLPHLVIAVIEGVVLGFTVGFLARVKPDLLPGLRPEETPCLAESAP